MTVKTAATTVNKTTMMVMMMLMVMITMMMVMVMMMVLMVMMMMMMVTMMMMMVMVMVMMVSLRMTRRRTTVAKAFTSLDDSGTDEYNALSVMLLQLCYGNDGDGHDNSKHSSVNRSVTSAAHQCATAWCRLCLPCHFSFPWGLM